jgi:hypothetical protein
VAGLYGTSWPELYRQINVNGLSAIGDYGGNNKHFEFLSLVTRTEAQVIKQLDLAQRFQGQPITRFICHPRKRLTVPDFCPRCLKEDIEKGRDNYIRHEWAIAGVSHCHAHRSLLSSGCGNCSDFIPRFSMVGRQAIISCGTCRRPIGEPYISESTWPNDPSLRDDVLKFEHRIIRGLLRGRDSESFKVIEDLAFLVAYTAYPWPKRRLKDGLGHWETPIKISSALRRYGEVYDACLLHPLSTVDVHLRWALTAAAIAISKGQSNVMLFGPYIPREEASLRVLFHRLQATGREELIARANAWPLRLRHQVKQLMDDPDATYARGPKGERVGWAASEERRWINDGTIPRYPNL